MVTRPGLRGKNLNAYALAGVRSDHESTELEEAREKLRLGMHLLVREGSTERNLEHIIGAGRRRKIPPIVPSRRTTNWRAISCSEGHLDHSIRNAIELGRRADDRDPDGHDQHRAALSIA